MADQNNNDDEIISISSTSSRGTEEHGSSDVNSDESPAREPDEDDYNPDSDISIDTEDMVRINCVFFHVSNVKFCCIYF